MRKISKYTKCGFICIVVSYCLLLILEIPLIYKPVLFVLNFIVFDYFYHLSQKKTRKALFKESIDIKLNYRKYNYILYIDAFNSVFMYNLLKKSIDNDLLKYCNLVKRLVKKFNGKIFIDEGDGFFIFFEKNVLEFISKLNSSLLKFDWSHDTIKHNPYKKDGEQYIFKGISLRMVLHCIKKQSQKINNWDLFCARKKISKYHKHSRPGEILLSNSVFKQINKNTQSPKNLKNSKKKLEYLIYKRKKLFYIIEPKFKTRVNYLGYKKFSSKNFYIDPKINETF